MKRIPPSFEYDLIALICKVEQSYFISGHGGVNEKTLDEAIVEIVGRIMEISPRYEQFLGAGIDICISCSRTFDLNAIGPVVDKPFLVGLNLKQGECSLMAYFPSDAFWALPQIIAAGADHVGVRFGPLTRGHAPLQSVHFASIYKFVDAFN